MLELAKKNEAETVAAGAAMVAMETSIAHTHSQLTKTIA